MLNTSDSSAKSMGTTVADILAALESEFYRATRAAEAAEQKRLDARTALAKADVDAQRANQWQMAVQEALEGIRDALPKSSDSETGEQR